MYFIKKACVVSVLILVLLSCSKKSDNLDFDPRIIPSENYDTSLNAWSHEDRIYSGLSAVAFMNVTFQSIEFRKAYVKEIAQVKILSLAEQKELLDSEIADENTSITFMLRVYTSQKEWNDFHKAHSIWKITLKNERNEVISPHEIVLLDGRKPELAFLYPDINRWVNVYRVTFKKDSYPSFLEETKSIELSIASFLARTSFSWTL
jgi:hypothetical protein